MTERTNAYHFTVEMKDGKPVGEYTSAVSLLRSAIKRQNKKYGTKKYVKLQGRGHRRGVRRYNQSLPLKYADSADVYVYTRR